MQNFALIGTAALQEQVAEDASSFFP